MKIKIFKITLVEFSILAVMLVVSGFLVTLIFPDFYIFFLSGLFVLIFNGVMLFLLFMNVSFTVARHIKEKKEKYRKRKKGRFYRFLVILKNRK